MALVLLNRAASRFLAVAVVTGMALGLAACSSPSSAAADRFTAIAPANRGAPLSVTGTDLKDEPLSLARYRGDVVVLNFWGSWCGPCQKEAPELVTAFAATKDQGVQFVGVDTQELSRANGLAFNRDKGVTYPSFYDQGGAIWLDLRKVVRSAGPPVTLILDRQGRLAARFNGPVTAAELDPVVHGVATEASRASGAPEASP